MVGGERRVLFGRSHWRSNGSYWSVAADATRPSDVRCFIRHFIDRTVTEAWLEPRYGPLSCRPTDRILAIRCAQVTAISRFSGRWFLFHACQLLGWNPLQDHEAYPGYLDFADNEQAGDNFPQVRSLIGLRSWQHHCSQPGQCRRSQ